uniref:Uncharacterized protein n=1 Tax=Pseudo-nitzschia australis TaxID=44445 RepID=A0A7S4APV0_9STRA
MLTIIDSTGAVAVVQHESNTTSSSSSSSRYSSSSSSHGVSVSTDQALYGASSPPRTDSLSPGETQPQHQDSNSQQQRHCATTTTTQENLGDPTKPDENTNTTVIASATINTTSTTIEKDKKEGEGVDDAAATKKEEEDSNATGATAEATNNEPVDIIAVPAVINLPLRAERRIAIARRALRLSRRRLRHRRCSKDSDLSSLPPLKLPLQAERRSVSGSKRALEENNIDHIECDNRMEEKAPSSSVTSTRTVCSSNNKKMSGWAIHLARDRQCYHQVRVRVKLTKEQYRAKKAAKSRAKRRAIRKANSKAYFSYGETLKFLRVFLVFCPIGGTGADGGADTETDTETDADSGSSLSKEGEEKSNQAKRSSSKTGENEQ